MRALGPKGSTLYENLSVISVNIVEEMTTRVKLYIDLQTADESRMTHKELKKKAEEGKRLEKCLPKSGHDDRKCRPLLSQLSREGYGIFTVLNQHMSVTKMNKKD